MLESTRLRLIHIHRCDGITRKTLRKLLQLDPSLQTIYTLSASQIHHYILIPEDKAKRLFNDLHNDMLRQELQKDLRKYKVITILDDTYPPMLKAIKDAPLVLYAMGNVPLIKQTPSISVIGTRKPSPFAGDKMKYIVSPLVRNNWVIISGMAKGIDSFAHRLSLHYHGKTIAVLGGGFNHIYPKENIPLFNQLIKTGLALSEYPPDTPPKPYHFPERNRIISGLSFATLVIEATAKSGTLITVDQALDQGREVYAVPGSPHIVQAAGCLQLIQDGAKLATSHQAIVDDWQEEVLNWQFE